jgi:hypothetical protein
MCLAFLPISVKGWAGQKISREFVNIDQVFDFIGSNKEYINVNGWSMLNEDYYISIGNLKLLANKASEFFELEQGYDFFSNEVDNIKQVNIRGVNNKGQAITIMCQSIQTLANKGQRYENYIVVDIVDATLNANSLDTKALMEEFFNIIGANFNITVTMVGSYKGELEHSEMQSICKHLFNCIQASVVEGIQEGGLISISGYSPLLSEGIVVGGRPMNVQVAMRYNSYKDKTYLWVGTPIICIEY